MLLIYRSAMPSIADVSRRMLRLAGMRIDPAANSRFRSSFDTGLGLRPLTQDKVVDIPLPEPGKLATVSWSHNSQTIAFVAVTEKGSQLWVADVNDPAKPKMLTDRLSLVTSGFEWFPDGKRILAHVVPADRGEERGRPGGL